ncbi:hypothetical protein [Candidatus Entotheonella palauensis]|uniref:hypothetical protein n=1 Tax=Candidatus Entotheonella palauensis TaxID=93172 RepID=UPI000B7D84B5|nr:hypothetical protein [Candidatus Entotheonella palauensis]
MRNVIGAPIDHDYLFNQESVIDRIWQRVEDQHVTLLSPRKFGKTSILLHLEQPPRDSWTTVLLDVSYLHSPEEFIGYMLGALASKYNWIHTAWQRVKQLPQTVQHLVAQTEVGVEPSESGAKFTLALRDAEETDWQTTAAALLRELDALPEKRRLLILIDEMGKMLELMSDNNRQQDARALMSWFKTIRSGMSGHLQNVRFVIASSIGIDRLVNKLGMPDAVEDLFPIYIDALPHDQACELFRQLAAAYDIETEPGVWEQATELLGGGVPEFIQMFFSEIRDLPQPITRQHLDEIYEQRLLGTRWRRSFVEYIDRFDRYGTDIRNLLVALLVTVARDGSATRDQLEAVYNQRRGAKADPIEFSEYLADLQADFYLRLEEGHYVFTVTILRSWILRYYGG